MTDLNPYLVAVATEMAGLIDRSTSILVLSHIMPDGDALGSLLGLGFVLGALGKQPVLGLADKLPESFGFLPGYTEITRRTDGPFDLIIALDASDERRLGDLYTQHAVSGVPVINLDHHVTNLHFGQVNLVEPGCAASAEVVFLLARTWNVPLTPEIATCLLTGLVTDTLGFRTRSTSARVLDVAAHLLEYSLPLHDIISLTLERRSLSGIQLWGRAFARATLHGIVIWSDVTLEDRRLSRVGDNGIDTGLSSYLVTAAEANVAVVFTERKGQVEVSMRARPGFDVSGVALALGGGGHPLAAGCIVDGTLVAVRSQVFAALDAGLAAQGYAQPEFIAPDDA